MNNERANLSRRRILFIGATGTIGTAVVATLGDRHEIIPASRHKAQEQVNVARSGFAYVNVVSPPWVAESLKATGQDPSGGLPASDVARAAASQVSRPRSSTRGSWAGRRGR